jgi:hypothetical protein
MYEAEDLKVLCGNTIEEPEMDYDDESVESVSGDPAIDSGIMQFYFVTITDHMATPDFRNNYLSVISKVRTYSTKHQQLLAFAITQKIPEKYDFQFSTEFTPYNQQEINELYHFIEFIEYNHEKFIVNVWKYLNPDSNSFDVEKFCEHNDIKIISEIEDQLESRYFPELIADFLRTYNKDKLIDWFCEKSKDLYPLILLALRKE